MFWLMAIMAMIVTIVLTTALIMLYRTALEQQQHRLIETVQSQTELIRSIAVFDAQYSQNDVEGGARAATLQQVFNAFKNLPNISATFEFVLARKNQEEILFLATRRGLGASTSFTVPLDSTLAEPMRRALNNESGSIIADDYEGKEVVAAFSPVRELDLGIVAKLDLWEIQKPFVRAAVITFLAAIVYIILGAWLFNHIGSPLIRKLSENEERYRNLSGQLAEANLGLERRVEERTSRLREEHQRLEASLEWNRALMDSAGDCIVTIGADALVQTFNKSAEEVFGYWAEEVIGNNVSMLMPPAEAVEHDKHIHDYQQTGKTFVIGMKREMIAQRKGGEKFPIELNVREVELDGSTRYIGIIRDLSEIKRTEQAIIHAEAEIIREHALNEKLLSTIPSILIGVDKGGTVTLWNQASAMTFGIDSSDTVGKKLSDVNISWDGAAIEQGMIQSRSDGTARIDNVTFQRPDGSEGMLGLTVNTIYDEGVESGFLLLGSDITRRLKLEGQLQLAQKMEAIGELAAGIAHEINTPLQYVGDNIRFLKDSFADMHALCEHYYKLIHHCEEQQFALELVESLKQADEEADIGFIMEEIPSAISQSLDGVDKASRIVAAMKEFSHPGQKEKSLTDLNRMLESTVTVARNEWKYVAEMKMELDDNLPLVKCLPEINQVFLNMIVNAAHAIAEKLGENSAERGVITIRTSHDDSHAEIRIDDTGRGIPQQHINKIFEPFFTTKEVGKGTGQGLAISHNIVVEKHQGTLEVESEPGKGTTFIIRLPLIEGR